MIVFLVVWAICAAVCATMAEKRHRDRLTWAVLGALFGVFAVLVLAVMGDDNTNPGHSSGVWL